ncbi:endo alpha-1,4 polygalactosaminidase [bacterium]|nr:endo alpha-1,4 polygalactosaminidase [bacterium]
MRMVLATFVLTASCAWAQVWQPSQLTTWQYQLQDPLNTSYDVAMYDIDMFEATPGEIDALHAQGRVVIGHFRAGVWQDWQPDAGDYPAALLGNAVDGWPGERWVDIGNLALIQPLIEARLDLAASKGFDGVEPDDMQSYLEVTGFTLVYSDQIAFNEWLAQAAHARGLSVGLKNDCEQSADLVDDFDWSLVEMIYQFGNVSCAQPFLDAGKAVFDVEYYLDPETVCDQAVADGVSAIFKSDELGDDPPGGCDLTGVGDPPVPGRLLAQNSPNPFNPRTTIVFDLPATAAARLCVLDAAGRLVDVLLDAAAVAPGRNEVVWTGRDALGYRAPAGVYFYRLETGARVETKKMTLLE